MLSVARMESTFDKLADTANVSELTQSLFESLPWEEFDQENMPFNVFLRNEELRLYD